jgi:surface polysaccharide O-acyltransferase-like enzyme
VGYLFVFSLIVLPLFVWLKTDAGRHFISRLAELCERRGGILLFAVPLVLIRFLLQPVFPEYVGWADFFFMLVFFISGHILYADQRFTQSIRRDGRLVLLATAIVTVIMYGTYFAGLAGTWMASPGTPGFYLAWSMLSMIAWGWAIFFLYLGMCSWDFGNKWLEYAQPMVLPFYMFHHPVIVAIAFFVVQWDAGIWAKLPVVTLGSLVVTLALSELVRRIKPLRPLFGMKRAR